MSTEEHYIRADKLGGFVDHAAKRGPFFKAIVTAIDPDDPYEKHKGLKGSHYRVRLYYNELSEADG